MITLRLYYKPRDKRSARHGTTLPVVGLASNKQGGFILFAGIKGTDIKTYAGSATSRATLDYNMGKAKMKFGLPLD